MFAHTDGEVAATWEIRNAILPESMEQCTQIHMVFWLWTIAQGILYSSLMFVRIFWHYIKPHNVKLQLTS